MNIYSVNNERNLYSVNNNDKNPYAEQSDVQGDKRTSQRSDSLELSQEVKNLKPILEKINSGIYDKPEIVREVAARISDLFPSENVNQTE